MKKNILQILKNNKGEVYVPEFSRWSYIENITQDLGLKLNQAIKELEKFNSDLNGIVSNINFAVNGNSVDIELKEIISHFSLYRFRNDDLPNDNILGDIFEYFLYKTDDVINNITPREFTYLIIFFIKP